MSPQGPATAPFLDRLAASLNAPAGASAQILLGLGLAVFAFALIALLRFFRRGPGPRRLEQGLSALARQNAELAGRVRALAESVDQRQSDLARFVAARLDAVGSRVGADVEASGRASEQQLAMLNERLAVIDAAQARLTRLSQEVVGLKEILGNKQARGAFGQGRMEAIVRDALPASAYAFQHRLSNGTRPDCVIRLPGDPRLLVVDAKFPLEAFNALKAAGDAEARRHAAARARSDLGKHVRDIAERYLPCEETQDLALMFVPSESLYADIAEHFEDVTQKAHRHRVLIVSPTLLAMAMQLMQAIARDARVREEAQAIQIETRRLVEDLARLRDGARRLDAHFNAARQDLAQILSGAERAARAGERIDELEFPPPALKAAE